MISDTLTTIENQFFDGLKAVQEPTVEAARRTADFLSQLPLVDSASALTSQLPAADEIVSRNFGFAQRLLDAQREFALELAGITQGTATTTAKPSKKSAS
jgi:hypothetical protein